MTFFSKHCEFKNLKLGRQLAQDMSVADCIYLDLDPKLVTCSTYVSVFNHHCQLDHTSLSILKFLVTKSSQTKSLECESCQVGNHHQMPYASKVNKRANHPFDLVNLDVWDPCSIKFKLDF